MSEICIVGAGFTGAVIAHELARAGLRCDVFEAGNLQAIEKLVLRVFGPG